MCWDKSSEVFTGDIEIIATTFFGNLSPHATSCPIWTDIETGYVTTLCPGNASHTDWGSSGGYAYTKSTGTEQQAMIVDYINNYQERNRGQVPHRLQNANIEDYVTYSGRRNNIVRVAAPDVNE